MSAFEELKLNENKAISNLATARQDLRDYWLAKHKEVYGIEAGVIVVLKDGKKAIVESVTAEESYGKPWVKGRTEKKDGSFGAQIKHLYNYWEILKEV